MEENTKLEGAKMQETEQPKPVFFEFGDVYFECNRCGNYERIQTGIKDGMQFVLPTSDQHEWRLVCGKCKNMMRIFFKESDAETVKEAKILLEEEEKIRKEQAEKVALDKAEKEANEPKKKDKKEKSTKGDSENPERVHESDGTGEPVIASTD